MMTTSASSNTIDPVNVAAAADTLKKYLDTMKVLNPSSSTEQTKDIQENNTDLFHIMLHGVVDADSDDYFSDDDDDDGNGFSVQKIINLPKDDNQENRSLSRKDCVADLTRYLVESVCPGILLKSIISKEGIANQMKMNRNMILNIKYGMRRETTMMIVSPTSGIPNEDKLFTEKDVSIVLCNKQKSAYTNTPSAIVDPQDNLYHRLCINKQLTLMNKNKNRYDDDDEDLPSIINLSLRSYSGCDLFFNHDNLDQASIPFAHRYLQVVVFPTNSLQICHLKYFPTFQLLKRAKPTFNPTYVSDLGKKNNNNTTTNNSIKKNNSHEQITTPNKHGVKRKNEQINKNVTPVTRRVRRVVRQSHTKDKPNKLKTSQSTKKSTTPQKPPSGVTNTTTPPKSKKTNASSKQSMKNQKQEHKKQNSQLKNDLTDSITKSKKDDNIEENVELPSDLSNLKKKLLGTPSAKKMNPIQDRVISNDSKKNPLLDVKLYSKDELTSMTLVELKKICTQKLIAVSGTKSKVIERILAVPIPGTKKDVNTPAQNTSGKGNNESKLSVQSSSKDDDQTSRSTSKSKKIVGTSSLEPKSKMPKQSIKTPSSKPKPKKSSSSATKTQQPEQTTKKAQKSPKSKKSTETFSSKTNIDAKKQSIETPKSQKTIQASSLNTNIGASTQTTKKLEEKKKSTKKRKLTPSTSATKSSTKKKKKISQKEDNQVENNKDSSVVNDDKSGNGNKYSSLDELNNLTRTTLKNVCITNGLKRGGSKAEMIERIWDYTSGRKKDESKISE